MSMRRVIIASVAFTAVVAITGVAVAYWTASGSGANSAATGNSAAVVVTQTVSPTGLYPGGAAALSGKFNNTNSGSIYVTAVTAVVTTFSLQADPLKPACTQADFSISGTAPVAAQVPVGTAVGSWTGLTLNMTNAGTNQDNCKNISVPITYTAT